MADNRSSAPLELETVTLDRDFTTNGQTIPAGTHKVSPEEAADLRRRNSQYNQYMKGIHERHVYEHDAGTQAVGGE